MRAKPLMGAPRNRRNNGNYWSSTTYSTTTSRRLGFGSANLDPSDGNSKGYGFAVRREVCWGFVAVVNKA